MSKTGHTVALQKRCKGTADNSQREGPVTETGLTDRRTTRPYPSFSVRADREEGIDKVVRQGAGDCDIIKMPSAALEAVQATIWVSRRQFASLAPHWDW